MLKELKEDSRIFFKYVAKMFLKVIIATKDGPEGWPSHGLLHVAMLI